MNNLNSKYLNLIAQIKNAAHIVVFLNKYPNEKEAQDGYYNRVLFIDQVFTGFFKVYINESDCKWGVSLENINPLTLQINLSPNCYGSGKLGELLINLADITYAHSIYQLGSDFKKILFNNSAISVWDIHGVVPEEEKLMGRSSFIVANLEEEELLAVKYAKYIVGVTKSIIRHIEHKYKQFNLTDKFIHLPIISTSLTSLRIREKELAERPVIIYSGGVHIWQQIDKMLDFVHCHQSQFTFVFLVSDPALVRKKYHKKFNVSFPGTVITAKQHELVNYYKNASYGLIFREDNLINNVACPTKLIDYLSYGIVPIFESPSIGDFTELGIRFYSKNDPILLFNDKESYIRMVEENFLVIDKLIEIANRGSLRLKQISGENRSTKANLSVEEIINDLISSFIAEIKTNYRYRLLGLMHSIKAMLLKFFKILFKK